MTRATTGTRDATGATTGVVGMGNPLRGDDGIVSILFATLRERGLPAGVSLVELGDAGFRLVHALADVDRAVIVDAVRFGGQPGEYAVFTPEEVASVRDHRTSHDSSVLELLQLSERMGERPDRVVIFGIEPADTSLGEGLSEPLEQRVDELADALANTVEEVRG